MKDHSSFPNDAQPSKSSGRPRMKDWPLMALEPPTTLPRGIGVRSEWLGASWPE